MTKKKKLEPWSRQDQLRLFMESNGYQRDEARTTWVAPNGVTYTDEEIERLLDEDVTSE